MQSNENSLNDSLNSLDSGKSDNRNKSKQNSNTKSSIKCEQLYNLSRTINIKREENQKRAEVEKVIKSLEPCTFYPKINKNEKLILTDLSNSPEILNRVSYDEYIDKQKKFRENNKQTEIQLKNRIGSGKNWKKQLTVPDKFCLSKRNKESRNSNKSYKQDSNHKTNKSLDVKVNLISFFNRCL